MTRQVLTSLPVTELTVGPEWDGSHGNWDSSRAAIIDRIILHTMVGTIASANARFNDPASNVSAHYGVGLDGSLVHWVDEDNTAYHAGDYLMNQRSIGIEHEDNGDYNGQRTDQLYQTSGKVVADICRFYNIPCDRDHIKMHNEVSDKPTACPDALDIARIVREAFGVLNPTPAPAPLPPTPPQQPIPAPIPPVEVPIPSPTPDPAIPLPPASFWAKLWAFIHEIIFGN